MEYILSTEKLSKSYGRNEVLSEVSIRIPRGSIYGLVGKNGAGKTTLMKLITGLHRPTSGVYILSGSRSTDPEINDKRRRMGALVDSPALYKELSAYDNIKIQMMSLGLNSFEKIPELLKLVGLESAGKKHAGKFSLGMRQRLGIAIAMCGEPDILVLDEPINGLDPQGIIEVREMLLDLNREKNTTILISSHILDELSRVATNYAFIDHGKILLETTSEELNGKLRKALSLKTESSDDLIPVLDSMGLEYKILSNSEIEVYSEINPSKIVLEAADKGIEITGINEKNETLESFFLNLVSPGGTEDAK